MLIQLEIENVAVIERASIEFNNGLNVLTGETGTGKSLIINSLNVVLGARSQHDLIREGADYAKVSAVFFTRELDAFLENFGISSDEGNIVISRKLHRDGRNICHINGNAVNVASLKAVGERLVVIHGQHDSTELMDASKHIHFLDAFSKNSSLLQEYKKVFSEYKEAEAMLSKLNDDKSSRQKEIDYLTYQTEEIEKAALSPEEEVELSSRKSVLENSEFLSYHAEKAYALLGSDGGARELLYEAKKSLEKLGEIDASVESLGEKVSDLYYELEELSRDVSSYSSTVEFNPRELNEINDRLDTINTLKRKYNMDIQGILDFYDEASEKLTFLKSFEENSSALTVRRDGLLAQANSLAKSLSLRLAWSFITPKVLPLSRRSRHAVIRSSWI